MNFSTTKMFKHKHGNRTYWFSQAGLAALRQHPTTKFGLMLSADYVIEDDEHGNQKFIKNRSFGNLERMIDAQFSEVEEIKDPLKG